MLVTVKYLGTFSSLRKYGTIATKEVEKVMITKSTRKELLEWIQEQSHQNTG